ncbi:hypothetical protein FQZ97_1139040 [compost metagenome]
MRRVFALRHPRIQRVQVRGRQDAVRPDQAGALIRKGLRGKAPGRNLAEIRVAHPADAIQLRQLHGLGEQMQRGGRAGAGAPEVEGLDDVQHLEQHDPARG